MSASTASRLKLLAELAALLPGPSTAVELLDRVEASGLLGTLRLVLVRSDEPRESSPGPDGLHRLQAALLPDETSGRQLELWGPSGPPPDGELGIVLGAIAAMVSALLERERLFSQVLRTGTGLAHLDALSRELNASQSLEAILEATAAGLEELVGARGVGLFRILGNRPELLGCVGEDLQLPETVQVLDSSGGLLLGPADGRALPLGTGTFDGQPVLVELLRGGAHGTSGLAVIFLAEAAAEVSSASRSLVSALAGHLAIALRNLELLEEMQRQATVDELTGLRSRRFFLGEVQREIDRARREVRPLSLLMLDVDHFKAINDRWGHAAGDAVLRELGACLLQGTRSLDVVGRLGGEEIGVLLPGVGSGEAAEVAERLRRTIAELKIPWKDSSLEITCSLGVAGWSEPMDPGQLLERGDRGLYRAKEQGRDRWMVAPEDEAEPGGDA